MQGSTDAPQAQERAPERLTVPRQTTPTWEVELLLSGAVVFALFQLPEPLHAWSAAATARMGAGGDMLVRLATVYALMVNYALIAMFLIHLTARAYWVSLVGIDSVFPGGVRWDSLRQGPIFRSEMQRQIPSFTRLIDRADNFASLCFAFGLLVVMSAVLGAGYAMPVAALSLLVSEYALDGQHLSMLFNVLLLAILFPLMLVGLADRILGRRKDARLDGRLAAAIRWVYRLRLNSLPAPLMLMLTSNLRGRRGQVVFFGALLALMAALLLDLALRADRFRFDGYGYLPPDAGGLGADVRHYREWRDPGEASLVPSIDSATVTGDYLRVLVPYHPERHTALIEQRCAADRAMALGLAEALGTERPTPTRIAAERQVLDCLARETDLRIDGAAPATVDLLFSQDPSTGLRGLLAVVPLHGLAPGRHALTLARVPPAEAWQSADALAEHAALGPLAIPFWR